MANDNTGGTARWRYGLVALGIGAGTLLAALLIVGWVWDKDSGALAAVTGAVARSSAPTSACRSAGPRPRTPSGSATPRRTRRTPPCRRTRP